MTGVQWALAAMAAGILTFGMVVLTLAGLVRLLSDQVDILADEVEALDMEMGDRIDRVQIRLERQLEQDIGENPK